MATFDEIRDIIANSTKVEKGKIVGTANFKDDLGMDSLEQAELIMELEKAFDCEIPEEEAEKIVTVNDAIKYLDSLRS
jgi:acyl carrier protein